MYYVEFRSVYIEVLAPASVFTIVLSCLAGATVQLRQCLSSTQAVRCDRCLRPETRRYELSLSHGTKQKVTKSNENETKKEYRYTYRRSEKVL